MCEQWVSREIWDNEAGHKIFFKGNKAIPHETTIVYLYEYI